MLGVRVGHPCFLHLAELALARATALTHDMQYIVIGDTGVGKSCLLLQYDGRAGKGRRGFFAGLHVPVLEG